MTLIGSWPRPAHRAAGWLGLGLLLRAGGAQAQLAPDSARLALKVDVAQLLRGTYEVEAEDRATPHLSLTVAPHLRQGTVSGLVSRTAYAAGDQVSGYGARLGPRYYFSGQGTAGALLAGWYVGLRADYQHLRLQREGEAWGEDPGPDGLRYYVFRHRESVETIRRAGGAASLGFQGQVLHPRLRLDAGASTHYLQSNSSAGDASLYRTTRTDYGHSGFFWSLNVGLGFVVK